MREDLQHYELIFIASPKVPEADRQRVTAKVNELISARTGRVTLSQDLGRRRLAYPIQHARYGFYQLLEFDLLRREVPALEQALSLYQDIARYLITVKQVKTVEQLRHEEAIRAKVAARKAKMKSGTATVGAPRGRGAAPSAGAAPIVATAAQPQVSLADLDKKLDEILNQDIVK